MFLSRECQQITDEYLEQGYVIRPVANFDALNSIHNIFTSLINQSSQIQAGEINTFSNILDDIHKYIPPAKLNNFRLDILRGINSFDNFRSLYFELARPYLDALVGNELAMQLRVNLSIQLPNDNSSLLPIHADTWQGDSAYEVVVWVPMVNCYKSKSMYIVPPKISHELSEKFSQFSTFSSEDLYQSIKHEAVFLDIKYGEVLIFNQSLPHGNRINSEAETRWSMNCRFKGMFTPYGDKKIGEFFEPITTRAATLTGMSYSLPKLK